MKTKSSNNKYSPNKKQRRDAKKLSKMIHNNERYMNVPHGATNKSTSVLLEGKNGGIDRNKVYS
jgi:hypothetical protein